jgi:hypothetical protein
LQKKKCETSPAKLLDPTFDGSNGQRHKQSLSGCKWKWFLERVPPNCGPANEDQRNGNDQKGIPGLAATPEQHLSEEMPQASESAVKGHKSERRYCRRVYGQK